VSVRRATATAAFVQPGQCSAAYMLGLTAPKRHVAAGRSRAALQESRPVCAPAAKATGPWRSADPKSQNHVDGRAPRDGAHFTEIGGQFHDEIVRGCGNHPMNAVVSAWRRCGEHLQCVVRRDIARGEYTESSKRRIALQPHQDHRCDRSRRRRPRPQAVGTPPGNTQTSSRMYPEQLILARSPQALAHAALKGFVRTA